MDVPRIRRLFYHRIGAQGQLRWWCGVADALVQDPHLDLPCGELQVFLVKRRLFVLMFERGCGCGCRSDCPRDIRSGTGAVGVKAATNFSLRDDRSRRLCVDSVSRGTRDVRCARAGKAISGPHPVSHERFSWN